MATQTEEDKKFLLKALITGICKEKQVVDLKYDQEFFGDDYKLFKKINERKADIPSVEHLKTKYKFEPVKTELTITDIVEQLDSHYFVEKSNKAIKDLLTARKNGTDTSDAMDSLKTLKKELAKIEAVITKSHSLDMVTDVDKVTENYENYGKDVLFVTTGFRQFDQIVKPTTQKMLMVCAPTGKGKTTALLKMLREAMKTGEDSVYFSLEMNEVEMQNRLIAFDGKYKYSALKAKEVSVEDYREAVMALGPGKVHLVTTTNNATVTLQTIEKYVAEKRPKYVFIDYLTLIDDASFNWDATISPTKMLKRLAGSYNNFMVVAIQSDPSLADDVVPKKKDIRGNKGFSMDADLFIGINSTQILTPDKNGDTRLQVVFEMDKNRDGCLINWQYKVSPDTGYWEEV